MDAIRARLTELEASNGRLMAQDGAHQVAIARLHSDVARISSEVTVLQTTVHEQGRAIADLSRLAVPEGFWVWELSSAGGGGTAVGGRSTGRWVWSTEKYAPAPTAAASDGGPPASLLSLPVELLRAIIGHLDSAGQKTLFWVCFRLLSVAFSQVYSTCQRFKARRAMLYIKARVNDFPRSPRISAVLDLKEVELDGHIGRQSDSAQAILDALIFPHPVVAVQELILFDTERYPDQLERWAPLLRFFNPRTFGLQSGSSDPEALPPTFTRVSIGSITNLLEPWTRLKRVGCYGPHSVPMVARDASARPPSRFALVEHLSRSSAFKGLIRFSYSALTEAGDELWREDVAEDDIENALSRPLKRTVPEGASIRFSAKCM